MTTSPQILGRCPATALAAGSPLWVSVKKNAILVTRQASGSAKIDPLMAAFNAIALMSTNPWSHQASIFVI